MEKTDKLTKAISLLLFLAVLSYIGVYIWRSVSNPIQTAGAITVTVRESATLSGIVVRDEQVVLSTAPYIDITAKDGRRISNGQALAVSYQSEDALARMGRVRELELEIARMETLLSEMSSAQDLTTRDRTVKNAVLGLTSAIARNDLSDLDIASLNLRSLVFDNTNSSVSYEALGALKLELSGLKSIAAADTIPILASASGIFSSVLDGFEHLSPKNLTGLSPTAVHNLTQDRRDVDDGAIGKLIKSSTWYFVAVANSADIWTSDNTSRLEEGTSTFLEFGRYYSADISANVVSIGSDADGECVVVFSCSEALADILAVRQTSAEVIYAEYTGIRVPSKAIHSELDADGETVNYVYVMTSLLAERKNIEIIYTADDFVLVRQTGESGSLRSGNEIIVSAKDLKHGKLMY